jgi:hypothetical protein
MSDDDLENFTHAARSALQVILSGVDYLAESPDLKNDAEAAAAIQDIRTALDRLNGLLSNLDRKP